MAAKRLISLAGGVVAILVAVAAWLTGGALTLTSIHPDAPRFGLVPSPVWLAIWLVVVFIARTTLRPTTHRFALLSVSIVLLSAWMPFPVPSAFYIWTGPMRMWLWVVVIAGVAAPVVVRRSPAWLGRIARDPRHAPSLAAAAAALVYLIGAYQVFPRLPAGDEPHYLVISQSILRDHDLKIENNHRRGDYRTFYSGNLGPDYLRRGVNGEIYSVHAPGLAVLVAPALALFGYPGVVVFLALISAWATAMAWTAAWRATSDIAATWFGWATVALTTPFVFQSFVVFPDAPGAALVMVGVLALVGNPTLSTARLAATGAALAMLPWLHTRFVIAAIMLAGMILVRQWTADPIARWADWSRRAAALLLTPIVSAACWFGFFYVIYGSPDPRAPYGGYTQSAVANLSRGIVGLMFDQQFGVLPVAPVFLCAFAGFLVLIRRLPGLAVQLLLLVTPYVLVVGAYQMWWGGNGSPGRFLVPVLLPMAIPAAVWFHAHRGHTARLLGLGGLTVSLLTTFTLASVDRGVLLYNFRDGFSRLLAWLSPLVNITTGLPSLFQTTSSAALFHGLVWIAAIALTAVVGLFVERRGARQTYVAIALGFSAVIASTLALSVVWRDHGLIGPLVTPAPGTIAFLRRYDPDSWQFVVRDRPIRGVRIRDVLANVTLADLAVDPETNTNQAVAAHVARYGPTIVFLSGGRAFMEPGGTWVEGGRSADFVISPDTGARAKLLVRNPPVVNTVTLEGRGWREDLVLAPGEERLVTLPFPAHSAPLRLRVTASNGARPTELERGSTDARFLGCWIAMRP